MPNNIMNRPSAPENRPITEITNMAEPIPNNFKILPTLGIQ